MTSPLIKISKNQTFIRILALIAALVISAGLFAGCAGRQNHYQLSDERLFGITNLDKIVEVIRDSLKNRSKSITVTFSLKGDYMEDISPFVKELMELAQDETGKADEGDYIRYQLGGYTFSYGHEEVRGGYSYAIVITPTYYSTLSQEQQAGEKVQEVLESLALPEDAGEYEKIRAVYDYIAENVKYDIVHKKNQYHTVKSTAYGALVNRSATCQGIAVTIYRLLQELGVDCRVITGMADSSRIGNSEDVSGAASDAADTGAMGEGAEYHAWNIVCIDGLYYNLDATWEKLDSEEQFFLKCDETFTGHERDEEFSSDEFCTSYPMAAQDYIPN